MRSLYLFLFIIMTVAFVTISCAGKMGNNLNQTGLIDQNGNLLTNTLIETNVVRITGDIPTWATNLSVDYTITTNYDSIEIKYSDNILAPNMPENPTDLYKVYLPYAGGGDDYFTVDYKDYNGLKQLWLDQINRRGEGDGKVFAIRNKANNRDADNFQNKHTHGNYSAQDYYYFNENGDIVWKEDNRIIKEFMGAIITEYRDIEKKQFGAENPGGIVKYTWKRRGVYTIGGIYANTIPTEQARWEYLRRKRDDNPFDNGDNPFKDGVFEFIAARERRETYWAVHGIENKLFERQYIRHGFIEVLVMNPNDNLGYKDAAGVSSYYAYSGNWASPTGFTPENVSYVIRHNLYLAERPEYNMPLLTHSTAFTDSDRGWCYLFMPGRKY